MYIGNVKATGMHTKAAVVETRIKPCCYQKKVKVELKSQQPWIAVSALLDLISIEQLADELCVAT